MLTICYPIELYNNKINVNQYLYLRFTDDPPPYIDGVKINSPHYLCKIILTPTSSRNYTIVVSQHEKSASIYYTLRAYATCPFTLSEIKDPYKEEKQVGTFQLIAYIFLSIAFSIRLLESGKE